MSYFESSTQGRRATESDRTAIVSMSDAVSLISEVRRISLLRMALTMAGIVGMVVIIVDRAGWMPQVNESAPQSAITQERSVEVDSDLRFSAISRSAREAPTVEAPKPTPTPILHTVRDGDSLLVIAANYGVNVDLIARANDLWDPNRLRAGQTLIIPGPEQTLGSAKEETPGELRMWWPLQGEITTEFGEERSYYIGGSHTGIDIAVNTGAPVRAAAGGKVVTAWKRSDNIGWHIILDHGNGWSTLYAHLSKFHVDEGDSVERGELIGEAGNTGFSFGPHLHFEVRRWGVSVDPMKYLP